MTRSSSRAGNNEGNDDLPSQISRRMPTTPGKSVEVINSDDEDSFYSAFSSKEENEDEKRSESDKNERKKRNKLDPESPRARTL